jgi:predicted nucleic acid-binding protein
MLTLQAILNLRLEKADEDVELTIQAYRWAERLGQLAVYDSVYLALTERCNADFYTADKIATYAWANAPHEKHTYTPDLHGSFHTLSILSAVKPFQVQEV